MRYCPFVWDSAISFFPAMPVRRVDPFTGEIKQETSNPRVVVYIGIIERDNSDCDGTHKAVKDRFHGHGLEPCCKYWDSKNQQCLLGSDSDLEIKFLSKLSKLKSEMKERGFDVDLVDL